jgi:hypothetical protein
MHALEPVISPGLYRGVARYIGQSDDQIFAFELQVIGREAISKMLITTLGPTDMKARALGYKVIEALSVKTRIQDSIIGLEPEE